MSHIEVEVDAARGLRTLEAPGLDVISRGCAVEVYVDVLVFGPHALLVHVQVSSDHVCLPVLDVLDVELEVVVTWPDQRVIPVLNAGPGPGRAVLLAVLHVPVGVVGLPVSVVVPVVVPALMVEAILDALVELRVVGSLLVILAVQD